MRGDDGSWNPAQDAAALTAAVHDNLRNLDVDVLYVVNMRLMDGGDDHGPVQAPWKRSWPRSLGFRGKG